MQNIEAMMITCSFLINKDQNQRKLKKQGIPFVGIENEMRNQLLLNAAYKSKVTNICDNIYRP